MIGGSLYTPCVILDVSLMVTKENSHTNCHLDCYSGKLSGSSIACTAEVNPLS